MPDTTSHDFNWEIQTFGDGNASKLRDVCIIDENNIWAVGEIYLQDSTGQFEQHPYNAMHWNGTKWELNRFQFPICGTRDTAPFPARAVFAFSDKEVWFTSAGTIIRSKDGTTSSICIPSDLLTGSINKFWGSSPDDVYIVGNLGTILHYDGETWQKIESGTGLDIQDIWGAQDPQTGEDIILAVASNVHLSSDREILKISAGQAEKLQHTGINSSLAGVWFDPGRIYYVAGAGIFSRTDLTSADAWDSPAPNITTFYSYAIRGNHINDVLVVGAFGDALHYNGVNWFNYRDAIGLSQGSYHSLAVKGDIVYAVGSQNTKALMLKGERSN